MPSFRAITWSPKHQDPLHVDIRWMPGEQDDPMRGWSDLAIQETLCAGVLHFQLLMRTPKPKVSWADLAFDLSFYIWTQTRVEQGPFIAQLSILEAHYLHPKTMIAAWAGDEARETRPRRSSWGACWSKAGYVYIYV